MVLSLLADGLKSLGFWLAGRFWNGNFGAKLVLRRKKNKVEMEIPMSVRRVLCIVFITFLALN
jgi:hypothetical protein